jgi:hypothetical protein
MAERGDSIFGGGPQKGIAFRPQRIEVPYCFS